ncbi:NERD domain-containing protein [Rhodococcus sp. NPDC019627]|nr:NERD domain-containing protein [Rhodococcus opacus]
MIPPIVAHDAPPGERQVFERLATDPLAEDWTVLHSLALAEHVRQTQGEADFVVVAPGHGIAVIEIKSHARATCLPDGRWQLGNHPPTARSPFQQSNEAMHSIREYLQKRGADLRAVPIVSGVWFTHLRARASLPASPEWHEWQLLDLTDFRTGAARAVLRLLVKGREHLTGRLPTLRQSPGQPSQESAGALTATLRPRFDVTIAAADLRHDRTTQLTAFLGEQYEALDAMAENRSVLFTGPAGSGKTFLALEASRREQARGADGRLLCFNRLLGRHLRASTPASAGLQAGGFHSELLRLTRLTPPPHPDRAFWDELLVTAIDRLLDGDFTRDFLIVDEMQDLARPAYLDVLDLMVKGGLAGGRCLFFGDFERQALYDLEDGRDALRERIPGLAHHRLMTNCRNRPRIGSTVELLAAMSPGYKRFRRDDDGATPRYYWYEAPGEQAAEVIKAIGDLKAEGYELDEIVLLSPRRDGSLAATTTDTWLRQILAAEEGTQPRKGRLRFATIHAYKGLEAPAIILTDIDDASLPGFDALLYVGLTRATDRLSLVGRRSALRPKLEV